MRVVDCFSGCGGLSKGFEMAGCDVVLGLETWSPAREVYKANFTHPALDLDLGSVVDAVSTIKPFRPDILSGGPPCQDFSAAGARIEGARANLTLSFAEIITQVVPTWFVIENVIGLRKSQAWEKSRKILSDAGYGITECVLDASFYGVPQKRRRFFAVGRLDVSDDFLLESLSQKGTAEPLTIHQYLGNELGVECYYRHPRNWGRKAIYSIYEPSATIRSTNRPVAPGYKPHPDDAALPSEARKLTPKQRSRIQTFDSSFNLFGTDTNQDIMVANAVPVNLAKHVAECIRKFEEDRFESSISEFKKWLECNYAYTSRTIGNVICRLNRADRMSERSTISSCPERVLSDLRLHPSFRGTSPSVRSQIKKALQLRQDFYRSHVLAEA